MAESSDILIEILKKLENIELNMMSKKDKDELDEKVSLQITELKMSIAVTAPKKKAPAASTSKPKPKKEATNEVEDWLKERFTNKEIANIEKLVSEHDTDLEKKFKKSDSKSKNGELTKQMITNRVKWILASIAEKPKFKEDLEKLMLTKLEDDSVEDSGDSEASE